MSDNNILANMKIGQELPPLTLRVERKTYKKYNRLIKEINPMHLSKSYVQKLGYDDVLVAGNFLYSYIPKWIINWIGSENVETIKNINVKFENPVYPDDAIIMHGKIVNVEKKNEKKIIECEFNVRKPDAERVFSGNIKLVFSI